MHQAPISTIEGRQIERIPYTDSPLPLASCKAGMVNIVFENYKRSKEGLTLIPILFCIDIDDNRYPHDIKSIIHKKLSTKCFTHSELRRAYKLCCELEDEELKEIAQKTFKFVKVKIIDRNYGLESIPAPWENRNWAVTWAKRKETHRILLRLIFRVFSKILNRLTEYISPPPKRIQENKILWRKELKKHEGSTPRLYTPVNY